MKSSSKRLLFFISTILLVILFWGVLNYTFGSRFHLPIVRQDTKAKPINGFRTTSSAPTFNESKRPVRREVEIKRGTKGLIMVRVFSVGGRPLAGVQAFAVPSTVRWLPDYGPSLGATGTNGMVTLSWKDASSQDGQSLLLVKKGYLSNSIPDPSPGKSYQVFMKRSAESIIYTRDRFGVPLSGVRIALSREKLPWTSVLRATKEKVPGPDPSNAIFLFFSDREGRVKVVGPPPGKYHFRALASSEFFSMIHGCDKNIIYLPCGSMEILFGKFWGVVGKIKGDEILAFRKTKLKGHTLKFSGIIDMRLVESFLSKKFKTPLVCAAVPSDPEIAPSVFFQVWLKKAGKKEFRVQLRKLDKSFKPIVYFFPPKESGASGVALIQCDPSYPFLRKISFDAVIPSKSSPLPLVSRKIVFGKKMTLPPGKYHILSWGKFGQEVLSRVLDPDHFVVRKGQTTRIRLSLKKPVAPIMFKPLNEDGSIKKKVALFFKKNGSLKWYTTWGEGRCYYLPIGLWEVKFYGEGSKKDSVFIDVRPSKKPIMIKLHLKAEKGG